MRRTTIALAFLLGLLLFSSLLSIVQALSVYLTAESPHSLSLIIRFSNTQSSKATTTASSIVDVAQPTPPAPTPTTAITFPPWLPTALISGAAAAAGIVAVYAAYQATLPFAVLESLAKKLDRKGYKEISRDIRNLKTQSSRTFSPKKIWREIDKRPYSAMKNLKTIIIMLPKGKPASDAAKEATSYVDSLSQVMGMFEGVTALSETDQRLKSVLKDFDESKGSSNAQNCVVFSDEAHLETKIMGSASEKDIWFCWTEDEDFEPLKIVYENGRIIRTLGRLHWIHVPTRDPYCDRQGRVEVLLWPKHHTPITRRNTVVCGAIFAMFVKAFGAKIQDSSLNNCVKIPQYSWKIGFKARHPPTVWYWGWKFAKSKK